MSIHNRGYAYPFARNHGSFSKKLAIWIDFERVCQTQRECESTPFVFGRDYSEGLEESGSE